MFKPGDVVCIDTTPNEGWAIESIQDQFRGKLELNKAYTVEETNSPEVDEQDFWPLLRIQGTPKDYWLDHNWFVAAPLGIFKPGDSVRLNPDERGKADQLPRTFSWDATYTVAEVVVNASSRTSIIRLEGSLIDWWDAAWFIAA